MLSSPIQSPKSGPSERVRNLITRATLLLVTIVLLYCSYRTVTTAYAAHQEAKELATKGMPPGTRTRVVSAAGLPMVVGIGLGCLGVLTGLGAVMPWHFFDRFVRPPSDAAQRKAAARDYFR